MPVPTKTHPVSPVFSLAKGKKENGNAVFHSTGDRGNSLCLCYPGDAALLPACPLTRVEAGSLNED